MKVTAILGGSDWNDASVEHVVLLTDRALEDLEKEYKKWYRETYLPNLESQKIPYLSFSKWLIQNSFVRNVTGDEVETFVESI